MKITRQPTDKERELFLCGRYRCEHRYYWALWRFWCRKSGQECRDDLCPVDKEQP
jgi:hypothetical protein